MTATKTRKRSNRRDRRLARASGWSRGGSTKPGKKVGHHVYESVWNPSLGRRKPKRLPAGTRVVYDDGPAPNPVMKP